MLRRKDRPRRRNSERAGPGRPTKTTMLLLLLLLLHPRAAARWGKTKMARPGTPLATERAYGTPRTCNNWLRRAEQCRILCRRGGRWGSLVGRDTRTLGGAGRGL